MESCAKPSLRCLKNRYLCEKTSILKKIIIAIDGHSSCGKSTLANDIGKAINYLYISTGNMYRAVTLYLLRHDIDLKEPDSIQHALDNINIDLRVIDGKTYTFLNDENVEDEIRDMPVSNLVSAVAALPTVRNAMVTQQRIIGQNKGVVMDGRDIGSVVFKDAELKLFLTADAGIRALRRHKEMLAKGHDVSLSDIKANINQRDLLDSTREISPLIKAEDAVQIDNTNLSPEEQLAIVLALVECRTR